MTDKIKILLVDDEERFRETTQKILSKRGFDTILAENGRAALNMIDQDPDVVILDIKMPGMDGNQTLTEIKDRKPDIPVIMLTGHGDKPTAREALIEGAFDYLAKPCDIDLLAGKIKEACRLKERQIEPDERSVAATMIPISEYSTIAGTRTVEDAIAELKKSFVVKMATNHLMETGHRSILVTDDSGQIEGIVTIRDLLEMVLPDYLAAPKPTLADSMEYSPMFWTKLFTMRIRELKNRLVNEIMSPAPISIDGRSNLMEAAYLMVYSNQRRLLVTLLNRPAGVIREQDLFFELDRILTC